MRNSTALLLVVCALIAGYFFGKNSIQVSPRGFIFDSKTFSDFKNGSFQSVYVAGTLTGDGVGYKDNTTAITCSKDKMQCLISTIAGLDKNTCQLGRLDAPLEIPIVKWDDYVITATDGNSYDTFSCVKTTINIDRKSETVEWVQEPINQSSISCKDYKDNKIYKWTIEDPEWYKNFKSGLKNK